MSAYLPSHIRDRSRHPMLAAVALWAAAHLAANADLVALLLFGSFLVFAIYDRISLSRRAPPTRAPGRGWAGDAAAVVFGLALWAATLAVGFALIVAGAWFVFRGPFQGSVFG